MTVLYRAPIGIFDSGFGGLTVLREIEKELPDYDYCYLGDNARAPYGSRSFDAVHRYTLEAVKWLFKQNCHLVILACNTASAKALRTIQQQDLPFLDPSRRVLGVIRPVTESIGFFTKTRHVGVLGTQGTVQSRSYPIEIEKMFPDLVVTLEACPLWVPLVECNEINGFGADYFVKKHIDNLLVKDPEIDTIVLGCTHYPLLIDTIKKFIPPSIKLVNQGSIVARSLAQYLTRHSAMKQRCSRNKKREFFTTDISDGFDGPAGVFYGVPIKSIRIEL